MNEIHMSSTCAQMESRALGGRFQRRRVGAVSPGGEPQ